MKNKVKKYYWALKATVLLLLMIYPLYLHNTVNPRSSDWKHLFQPLNRLQSLINYLEDDGLPEEDIHLLFLDPRVEIYPEIIYNILSPPRMDLHSSMILQNEMENYEIRDFMHRYDSYLNRAQDRFGVEKEAVVAVLFVETKLGKFIGNHSVFNVLASVAISDDVRSFTELENYIHTTYHHLPYEDREEMIEQYQTRAIRKAEWARAEMANLIRLHLKTNMDVLELPGSYAGAFGYAQFMPTSVLEWGIDGDRNGRIDMYTFPDAILSVANFLQHKGWHQSRVSKMRALYRYNYSDQYVNSVLNVAAHIRKQNLF